MSLPVLQQLFSNNDSRTRQTDIVMLITPRIIRTHEYTAQDLSPIYVGTNQNFGLTGPPPLIAAPWHRPRRPAAPPPAPPVARCPPQGLPGPSVPQAGTPGLVTTPGLSTEPRHLRNHRRSAIRSRRPVTTLAPDGAGIGDGARRRCARRCGPILVPLYISGVSRASTVTLTVTFNPAILRVRTVQEGSFLRQGGGNVVFTPKIDAATGRMDLTFVRTGDTVGASGSGLARRHPVRRGRRRHVAVNHQRRGHQPERWSHPAAVRSRCVGRIVAAPAGWRAGVVGESAQRTAAAAATRSSRSPSSRRSSPSSRRLRCRLPRSQCSATGRSSCGEACARYGQRSTNTRTPSIRSLISPNDIDGDADGYPPTLQTLVEGVPAANDTTGRKLRFLRRVPFDPMTRSRSGACARRGTCRNRKAGVGRMFRCLHNVERPRARWDEIHLTGRQLDARGFTLIELLIVVTLIVVLAGIGLSTYTTSVTRAKEAVLLEDLFRIRDCDRSAQRRQGRLPAGPLARWSPTDTCGRSRRIPSPIPPKHGRR